MYVHMCMYVHTCAVAPEDNSGVTSSTFMWVPGSNLDCQTHLASTFT